MQITRPAALLFNVVAMMALVSAQMGTVPASPVSVASVNSPSPSSNPSDTTTGAAPAIGVAAPTIGVAAPAVAVAAPATAVSSTGNATASGAAATAVAGAAATSFTGANTTATTAANTSSPASSADIVKCFVDLGIDNCFGPLLKSSNQTAMTEAIKSSYESTTCSSACKTSLGAVNDASIKAKCPTITDKTTGLTAVLTSLHSVACTKNGNDYCVPTVLLALTNSTPSANFNILSETPATFSKNVCSPCLKNITDLATTFSTFTKLSYVSTIAPNSEAVYAQCNFKSDKGSASYAIQVQWAVTMLAIVSTVFTIFM